MLGSPSSKSKKDGFTLLELLIVIAILAILGSVLIFVLNPAETLRKTRDSQRISDLATLKSAIGLYLTATSTPYLTVDFITTPGYAAPGNNTACQATAGTFAADDVIHYSLPQNGSGGDITDTTLNDSGGNATAAQSSTTNLGTVFGYGWIPINFNSLTGGSPIGSLPIDPTNTITTLSAVATTDLVYRYVCESTNLTFEINANLESTEYTTGAGNKESTDGGNHTTLYEVGTNLLLLSNGAVAF